MPARAARRTTRSARRALRAAPRAPQWPAARARRARASRAALCGWKSWLLDHGVTHAAHGDDVVRAQLFAQGMHEHFDRVALDFFAPGIQLVAELFAREHG